MCHAVVTSGEAAKSSIVGDVSLRPKGATHEHPFCRTPHQGLRHLRHRRASPRRRLVHRRGRRVHRHHRQLGLGKSTLLHLLGGVDRPTSGTVRLQGQDIFARSDEELAVFRRREVGLVYQFYNLTPILDVVENMTLPVRMDGRDVNEKRLKMLLRSLGLTGREHYLPNQLSGGRAAACGNRPRAHERPGRRARRRAHGQPRLQELGRRYGGTCAIPTDNSSKRSS